MKSIRCAWLILTLSATGSFPAFAMDRPVKGAVEADKPSDAEIVAVAALSQTGVSIDARPNGSARFLRVAEARERFSDAHMPLVAQLESLEGVNLWGSHVTDAGLRHIAKLHELRSLYLNEGITDRSMPVLKDIPALRRLHFMKLGQGITDESLRFVAQLKYLEDLKLSSGITDTGIAHLQWSSNLTAIDLGLAQVTDGGLKHLSRLTKLKSLALHAAPQLTGEGLKHLDRSTEIEFVALPARFDDRGMAHLTPFQKLRSLQLAEQAGVTDEGLVYVKQLGGLQSLYLGAGITDAGVKCLEETQLTHLDLRQTQVTDACFESLLKIPTLTSIALPGTITHEGLERLLELPRLRTFTVTNGLTDAAIPVLMKFTQLKYVTLDSTGLSKEGIDKLKEHLGPRTLLLVP